MAYQPKSYKKFVATAATATLVASAIAPVASAASFSDVADRYKEAVDYIVEKGYAQGYPGGTKFGTNDNIKRQDAAVMVAKALGATAEGDYPAAGFTDVPADRQWAVNFLKDKKVIDGKEAGKFGANDFMTRGEMAKVIANAYELVGNPDNEFPFTDVSATFKEYVDALVEAGVTQGKTATQFATGQNVTRGEFALFVYRAENPSTPVTPDVEEVLSVAAVNGKTLQVNFGKAVSEDDLIDVNGNLLNNLITLEGVDLGGNAAELDESGKALTVYFTADYTSGLTAGNSYVAVVNDVKMENGSKFPKFTQVVKADEKVAPSVTSATSVTKDASTRTISLKFSEPVSFSSIKVDGKFAAVSSADAGFGQEYTVTAASDLDAGKSYEIEINNLKDTLGNEASNIVKTAVTVVRDTVAPTFTVSAVNETTIDVTFDKRMNPAVAVDSFRVTKSVNGSDVVLSQSGLATLRPDGKTFRITLAGAPFDSASQASKEVSVDVKNLRDYLGNAVTAKEVDVTVVRDTVKPQISSAVVKPGLQAGADTVVTVDFTEAVSGVADADFYLTNASGNDVKVSSGATSYTVKPFVTRVSASKYEVKFGYQTTANGPVTYIELPESGTYNLVLIQNSVTDTATVPNTNDAQVVPFTFSKAAGTVSPITATITNFADLGDDNAIGGTGNNADVQATSDAADNNRKVSIVFNQNVVTGINTSTGTYKEGAADNPANYTLNGNPLPAGTSISVDGRTVVLDFNAVNPNNLPTALKQGGSVAVSASGVKSTAGATLPYTTSSVEVADTTEPVLTGAYLTKTSNADGSVASYVITAEFSEALTTTGLDLDDFVFEANNVAVDLTGTPAASVALSSDLSKVVITVTDSTDVAAIKAVVDANQAFELSTAGITSTEDKAGNTLEPSINVDVVNFAK